MLAELIRIYKEIDVLQVNNSDQSKADERLMKQLRIVCENCNFYGWRPTDDLLIKEFVERLTRQIDEYEK